MTSPPNFRNSIKAVIIEGGRILLTVNQDPWGEFLLLPGGGQHFGETMREAVTRECREELNAEVLVGDLIGAREYIGAHHDVRRGGFARPPGRADVLSAAWRRAPSRATAITPTTGVTGPRTGIEWVALADLPGRRLYPAALREWLPALPEPERRYLGDVN